MSISSTGNSQTNQSNPYAFLNGTTSSSGTSSTSSSTASSTGAQSAQAIESEFMTLLTTQLQQQDPTNPMNNSQITSQMAEISQVSGMQGLQTSMQSMASSQLQTQSLLAATTIGRQALVQGSQLSWNGNTSGTPVVGAVSLASAASQMTVSVQNSSGQTVDTLTVNSPSAGMNQFSWNGTDSNGNALPAGTYTFSAQATTTGANGQATQVATTPYANQTISSVSWDSTGATQLQLANGTTVPLSSVQSLS